jgi:GntR family transcriptional repressor for pyruvate dehydrogenase complex
MWQSIVARGAVEATLASHRSIYNALLARDADTAAAADLMHLAIAEEWLRKVLEQGQDPAGPSPLADG